MVGALGGNQYGGGNKPAGVKITTGSIIIEPVVIFKNGFFIPIYDGRYGFRVWGFGGSGAYSGASNFSYSGGAAAYCYGEAVLKKGQSISCIVGSGITSYTANSGISASVTLPKTTLIAGNGGNAGYYSSGSNYFAGIGGTASGGILNYSGGSGAFNQTAGGLGQGSYAGIPGSAQASNGAGGGSAPGDIVLRGGDGGNGNGYNSYLPGNNGLFPGGGGGGSAGNDSGTNYGGGSGGGSVIIITYEGIS